MTTASSSFSSIALPIAAIVATLVAAILGAWVVYAVGVPRRKLLYGITKITSVLPSSRSDSNKLEVRHDATIVKDPRIIAVRLVGRGSRDVPSSLFDSGKAIEFNIGIPIIAILHVTSEPKSLVVPKAEFHGTVLKIGPSLIGKHQKISITLLADGNQPRIDCQAALENVKIKPLWGVGVPIDALLPLGASMGLFCVVIAVGTFWALTGTRVSPIPPTVSPVMAAKTAYLSVAGSVAIVAILTGIVTWRLWKHPRV
jgi:hypothetical protein